MKEQTKEIMLSLLNSVVLGIIFTGLSNPTDGAILAIIIIGIILVMGIFFYRKYFCKVLSAYCWYRGTSNRYAVFKKAMDIEFCSLHCDLQNYRWDYVICNDCW